MSKEKLVKVKAKLPLIKFGLPHHTNQVVEVSADLADEIVEAGFGVLVAEEKTKVETESQKK